MSEMPTNPASGPVAGNLSPMEAVRMGWRLLMSDFWAIALAGLVVAGILLALRFVPCVSYCEPIIVPFLWPPLMAGLFLVIHRRIDGYPVDVGAVFDGFRQRYWQSVVAALPITLVFLVMGALLIVVMMGAGMGVGMLMPQRSQDMELAQVAVMYGAIFVAILIEYVIVGVISLFLMFAMLIVWERPESGWEAAKASARLVTQHLGEAAVFGLIFAAIWLAALFAGVLAMCVGLFFTMAVFQAWHAASVVYLYRSWTGRPLAVPEGPLAAPLPTTSIEPPSGL